MLLNYFKIAWRNLWKNKTLSAINLTGLCLGIACTLLILFHVKEELSYDKAFSRADRIFRVTQEGTGNDPRHWAATSPPMGLSIQQYFPEIEHIVRFHRPYPYQVLSHTSAIGQVNRFQEKGGFFADSSVIDVFDLQFSMGNPATALSETDAIVLTEGMARKYFGDEDPLGKIIEDDVRKLPLKVTGVIKEFRFHTHLQFDYLLSMATINRYQDQSSLENRKWSAFYTYVLLNKVQAKAAVEAKMPGFMVKFYEPTGETRQEILAARKLHLQPITAIHLRSKLEKEMSANSDITYIYIFSIAALFILLVAAVNFINISTAQAFNRMKEIGLRKVAGATKQQLIGQFLGESLFIMLLATLLATVLFKAVIPFYDNLSSNTFHQQLLTLPNLGILLLLVITIGLLAGMYPAWFVANFNPVTSLKGKRIAGSPISLLRKGLIVFQFAVSVFMIFSTIIIYRQMQLFHHKDLGFDKEQVVALTMYGPMWEKFGVLIDNIHKNSAITGFSVTSTIPGDRFSTQPFTLPGATGKGNHPARIMWSDDKLLSTLQIPLKEGRNFLHQFPEIKEPEFILNEAAVKTFHLKNAIGAKAVAGGDTGVIVGIVKDFNFASLHSPVEPLVIQYHPYQANYLLIKVQANHLPETLNFLESNIKSLSPSSAFTYTFMDEKMNRLYESENRMSTIFKAFAAFAILISCLGLFGLSAYSAQLRIKEVSIRKVLGASASNVALLLSKEFMALVLLAAVISWPLAWWAMTRWLEGFAYRINIDSWVFILSGSFALLIALLTISVQTIKVALLNPVKNLKME